MLALYIMLKLVTKNEWSVKTMEVEKGPAIVAQAEPKDAYKVAYIIHFLLGAGNLLPWNAFITAIDYFGSLYPTKHIEKVFAVAYMSSSVLVLVLVMIMSQGRWMSYRLRMNMGFSLFVLSMMVAPTLDWSSSSSSSQMADRAYCVTVASIVACGFGDGLIAGTLIGSAGKLPKQYMQAVFAGTASSGVLVSILRIITKALLPQTPQGLQTSAHFYFIVTTIILLCCIFLCNLLYKLPVMEHHLNQVPGGGDLFHVRPKFWAVARKIQWPGCGILTIYVVTLSIFPGFLAEDLKSNMLSDWYPLLLITIYNASDLVGKSVTAIYVLKSIKTATWGCILRLVFYPLFAACLHGPTWLKTEVPVVVLTFMLGISNGYLTSVLMILAPKSVPGSEAELAAIVMVVFLGIGLVSGSLLGWFWII
ncbi:Equilibrative nucleotide transporter 8 [Linum grandiflorum]